MWRLRWEPSQYSMMCSSRSIRRRRTRFEMKVFKAVPVMGLCAVALMGCQSLRDAAGLQKKSPDEFAVTTKAPLVIPPDFNLRPPMPGAAPVNQTDPGVEAQQALFNTSDPATV